MNGLARYLSKNAGTTPNNTSNILPQAPVTNPKDAPLRRNVESPGPFGYKQPDPNQPITTGPALNEGEVAVHPGTDSQGNKGQFDGLPGSPVLNYNPSPDANTTVEDAKTSPFPGQQVRDPVTGQMVLPEDASTGTDNTVPTIPTDIDGVPPTEGQLDTAQGTTPWYDSPGVQRDENDQPIWPGPGPEPDPGTEGFYQQFPGQEEVAQTPTPPAATPVTPPYVEPGTFQPPAPEQSATVAQPNEFYDTTMAKNFAGNLKSFAPGQVNKTYDWMRNSGNPELVAQAGQGHIPFNALNSRAQKEYVKGWEGQEVVQPLEDKAIADGRQKIKGKSAMPSQFEHMFPKRYPQAAPRNPDWR
jgi:hypothetical protein